MWLGLAQPELGEFHLMIEIKDLAQPDRAVDHVAERSEPTDGFHFGVNSLVQNVAARLLNPPGAQRLPGCCLSSWNTVCEEHKCC